MFVYLGVGLKPVRSPSRRYTIRCWARGQGAEEYAGTLEASRKGEEYQ